MPRAGWRWCARQLKGEIASHVKKRVIRPALQFAGSVATGASVATQWSSIEATSIVNKPCGEGASRSRPLPMAVRDALSMQRSMKGLVGGPLGSFANMGARKCPSSQHMSWRLALERDRILLLRDARSF